MMGIVCSSNTDTLKQKKYKENKEKEEKKIENNEDKENISENLINDKECKNPLNT